MTLSAILEKRLLTPQMKIVDQKEIKNFKVLFTIVKTVDTFVNFATTSSSVILSITGFGLILIPNSTGIACGLTPARRLFVREL